MIGVTSSGGVFAVSRGIFDDPDFLPEPFTQREAFMWLVASAAWRQHKTRGAYGPLILERGEFSFSIRFLAERWKWSKSRVDRFMTMLKNRDIVKDTKRDSEHVWIINKYNDFQILAMPSRDTKRDTKRDSSGTVAGQQRDKEEGIEDIKGIEGSSLRSDGARASPKKKGSRLPDDWKPSEEDRTFATSNGFSEETVRLEADKFRDFWISKAGRDGSKLDWAATWRNWLRNSGSRGRGPPQATKTRTILDLIRENREKEQENEFTIDHEPEHGTGSGAVVHFAAISKGRNA